MLWFFVRNYMSIWTEINITRSLNISSNLNRNKRHGKATSHQRWQPKQHLQRLQVHQLHRKRTRLWIVRVVSEKKKLNVRKKLFLRPKTFRHIWDGTGQHKDFEVLKVFCTVISDCFWRSVRRIFSKLRNITVWKFS